MKYLKRLNWTGFGFTLTLCMLAALANKNVNSFIEWCVLVLIFGIPFSLFPLFAGIKPKK